MHNTSYMYISPDNIKTFLALCLVVIVMAIATYVLVMWGGAKK